MNRPGHPNGFFTNIFRQLMPLFRWLAFRNALLHLDAPLFAGDLIRFFKKQGSEVTFGNAGGIAAAQVAFKRFSGSILLDHTVWAGADTVTAAVAFRDIDGNNPSFVFKYGLFGTGFQTIRFGALKTNARDRVSPKWKIVDFETSLGGHKHPFLDGRAGIDATVAARAAIGYSQQMLFHKQPPI